MADNQIGRLLGDLWSDLQEPAILWQVGVLALCITLAWWIARLLQWRAPEDSREAVKRGAAAFRRIAFPLFAMVLLLLGRALLGFRHNTNLLSVVIPLFGSLAGIRFAVYLLRLGFRNARWLDSLERSIATLVWAVVALHLTGLLPAIVRWLSEVEFAAGAHRLSLMALLSGALWVLVTIMLALWAGAALEDRLMRAEGLHMSLRVVLARVGRTLLIIVAVLVALPLMGVDLTVLSVFGGALGVGLGLGLQKIASNYLSGFILLLDRSIRLGDMITADGHHGQVTRITTRYVVVRSPTGVEAIIPNDTLVTTTVLNHSYTDKNVRLAVRVQVAYGTDVPEALKLLAQTAGRHPRVLRDPAPGAHVFALADNGVDIEVGFWISDLDGGSLNVRSDVSIAILQELAARGIEIPFPRRDIRVLQGTSDVAGGQ
ncbi:MAG TPA: mechanosensitive ion channel domain-containing protein [Burkholderiales bacterium]|jgi:small-conductance mechanosensitive channel|nr:mechanosensitive ion channel domain-containing protein [Burkholderiales bacterium]